MEKAVLVAGLGFGDCGKGSIVQYLTEILDADMIVKHNGTAQCAHNVITSDNRHHTFSQFGSGTFTPKVKTFLSEYTLIDPMALLNENSHLESLGVMDALSRMYISAEALVITPFQRAANKLREIARDVNCHGSCGVGVGETRKDSLDDPQHALYAGDLFDKRYSWGKLEDLQQKKYNELKDFPYNFDDPLVKEQFYVLTDHKLPWMYANLYEDFYYDVQVIGDGLSSYFLDNSSTVCIFEGSQGVLLDETYGFLPYATWTDTTFNNALKLLPGGVDVTKLGVIRSYMTRHGPGPFVTETKFGVEEPHNPGNQWQLGFRTGYFDLVMLRYALEVVGGVDFLALTHCDRTPSQLVCNYYEMENPTREDYELFDFYKGFITGISVHDKEVHTVERQERLAQRLLSCKPHLVPLDSTWPLSVEVGIESWGPKASEKETTNAFRSRVSSLITSR